MSTTNHPHRSMYIEFQGPWNFRSVYSFGPVANPPNVPAADDYILDAWERMHFGGVGGRSQNYSSDFTFETDWHTEFPG